MRIKHFILSIIVSFSSGVAFAQIEGVHVETYYVSDQADATDTFGGHLEEGSKTYRIFIDLLPGSRILSIFGEEGHPLIFSSPRPFFNHRDEGISFGKDLNKNRYGSGTTPLDTYITIGQCSKSFAQGAYFGVPKSSDPDGSIVGGVNNDGGSNYINGGLLNNASSDAGIPVTISDGLAVKHLLPDSWIEIGFKDILTDEDTTIFGSHIQKSDFYSTDALLRNSGVNGVDSIQNEILIAQLTTKGEISFELNMEVEIFNNGVSETIKFVARNDILGDDEIFSPWLKFPFTCGCTDPDYLEASTTFACTDNSQCITPVVLGCTDSLACNYNPDANFNVPDLCCYIGYCHNLDISVACPNLKPRDGIDNRHIRIYPNPAFTELNLEIEPVTFNPVLFQIRDILGHNVLEGKVDVQDSQININELVSGQYIIQVYLQDKITTIPFIKL
ncbi:MAG TPA: T9SS type A sorting domain-containing protein [Saprospiraceae bacterium]|nr:T9SS type A sorting domain-containing protein [Saprospiraceae bacterium]